MQAGKRVQCDQANGQSPSTKQCRQFRPCQAASAPSPPVVSTLLGCSGCAENEIALQLRLRQIEAILLIVMPFLPVYTWSSELINSPTMLFFLDLTVPHVAHLISIGALKLFDG